MERETPAPPQNIQQAHKTKPLITSTSLILQSLQILLLHMTIFRISVLENSSQYNINAKLALFPK